MNIQPPMKTILLGACAAVALVACGSSDKGSSDSGKAASNIASFSASPLDKPYMLKDAEPIDVDALFGGMLSYDTADFDGKIGATVLTNVTGPAGGEMLKIGRVELYGVDTDTIDALKSGEPMEAKGELFNKVRLYDLATAFPIEETGGNGTISVDALEIDTLALQTGGSDDFADIAKAVTFGGLSLKGMSMNVVDAPEAMGDISMAVKDMRLGDYDAGKFGGMKLAGMSYEISQDDANVAEALEAFGPAAGMLSSGPLRNILFPEKQSGTIGTMSWNGLNMSGLLGYLEKDEKPPITATDLISVGAMTFTDMTQDVNGKRAGSVKKFSMAPIEFEHFMPKAIKIVSEGEEYDLTAYAGDDQPEILEILKSNGLDNVTGNSKLNYAYSSKAKTISVDMQSVAKGLLNTDFDLSIGNFDYAAMASEDADEAAAMGITVDGMTLKLADQKFLDTAFAIAGQAMEQDPAALRQQANGLISLGSLQGAAISPRVPAYASAISTWITEGGALEIKVNPEEPASVAALAAAGEGNPGAVLETLNLTVTQTK